MLEIIIPPDFITDLSAVATEMIADLFPIWIFVAGIPVGLFILGFLVDMVFSMHGKAVQKVRVETMEMSAEMEDAEMDFD